MQLKVTSNLISNLLIPILCLGLMASTLQAQINPIDSIKITANFQKTPIIDVLNQLKKELPINLYFQAKQLPQKVITQNYQASPLNIVLTDILQGSNLGFLPYRDYAVIIAKKATIQESFSSDYYRALENSQEKADGNSKRDRKLVIGKISAMLPNGQATINGTIKDEQTNEPIIGATVFFPKINKGTATDFNGNFEVVVPVGEYEAVIQYIGYEDIRRKVAIFSNGALDLVMVKTAINLEEIIVKAKTVDVNVEQVQIGKTSVELSSIKKLPALLGEADVVRALLINPGVSTVGEGATGFNVRGGSVDQNLVFQDEGFLFNTSHALGFFSTFNHDLIKSVDLYKGNIPAEYGGRLASVLDVQMRDGNFEKFKIKGGAGPVSSRISLEGPIIPEKSSFLAGFRSTYANWFLDLVKVDAVRKSSAFFYDFNLRYTHKVDKKNTFTFSTYASSDNFVYNQEFGFDYQTLMGQFIYKRIFNERSFNKFSFVASSYQNTQSDFRELMESDLNTQISYFKIKDKFTFNPKTDFTLNLGGEATYYFSQPGSIQPSEGSRVLERALEEEKGLETAIFINTNYELSTALEISGGLRLTLYNFLGPKTVNQYRDDQVNDISNFIGSEPQTGILATYSSFEPRFSLRYRWSQTTSFKAGYSRTAQYINQIFNTVTPTPTSQFQLSTAYIQPQRSHNFSLGIFKNLKDNQWETSAEVFARSIDQIFDYQDFADLTVNPFLETELVNGIGRSAGLELSIKKTGGFVNGFLGYTLSRTELKIDGINDGEWYPNNIDKPHDLSLVLNFNRNQRHTFTLNFNYSSGRPITPPFGNYQTEDGIIVPLYLKRNAARIPAYHRLDVAYTFGKGYKIKNKVKTSWTVSIYNVYGRRNAFSVFYNQQSFRKLKANKLAILGSAFPALTFNLEIL